MHSFKKKRERIKRGGGPYIAYISYVMFFTAALKSVWKSFFAYLPAFEISSKISKGGREPIIDTVKGQLLFWNLHDRLNPDNRK